MSAQDAVYEASQIKRYRATALEIRVRRAQLRDIVARGKLMTVRQVFYQATVAGVVEKSEAGYTKVQTDLVLMRRAGDLPYSWLTDSTRWQHRPDTFGGIEHALIETARLYRKSLWNEIPSYVEIWLEKDALSGVLMPVTYEYDVPLMVARGYASLSFLHGAAEYIGQLDCPAYIYHLGDYDPSGVNAGETIERTLRELAPHAEIHFQRLAVTRDQIDLWNLPTRPTKTSDSRSKGFGEISVELDAIPPAGLRALVRDCIEEHLPRRELEILKVAEASERKALLNLIDGWRTPEQGAEQ